MGRRRTMNGMPEKTVGFIGLGIMGLAMAKNLVDAGYEVVGHNRSPEPVEDLEAYGGSGADSPAAVAEQTDVVIMCLPDSPDVEQVVLGNEDEPNPVMNGLSPGMTVIDMSTISPSVAEAIAEELAARDVAMLDAPISGGEEGAVNGTLSIMVGGEADVVDEHRDLFDVMGASTTHCGPSGAGQVTKACNQIVVAVTYQAVSEALLFAERAGADLQSVVDAISGGAAGCWVLDNRADRMIRGNFEPGFFAEYQYKDLRIATEGGENFGSPMPATELVHEMYKSMVETGRGRDDHSGVLQIVEMLAGTEARIDEAT